MNYAAHYLYAADGALYPQWGVFAQEGGFQILPLDKEVASTIFINGILFPFIAPDFIDQLTIELQDRLQVEPVIDMRGLVGSMSLTPRSIDCSIDSIVALEGCDLSHLTLNNRSRWVVLAL